MSEKQRRRRRRRSEAQLLKTRPSPTVPLVIPPDVDEPVCLTSTADAYTLLLSRLESQDGDPKCWKQLKRLSNLRASSKPNYPLTLLFLQRVSSQVSCLALWARLQESNDLPVPESFSLPDMKGASQPWSSIRTALSQLPRSDEQEPVAYSREDLMWMVDVLSQDESGVEKVVDLSQE